MKSFLRSILGGALGALIVLSILGAVVSSVFTGGTVSSPILLPDGTASAPAIASSARPTEGFRFQSNIVRLTSDSAPTFILSSGRGIRLDSISTFGWTVGADSSAVLDVTLQRGGAPGALRIFSGTTPTASNCGTSPTLAGNNSNGQITIGATPGTCVITFNGTWTNAPRCHLNNRTSAVANRATSNSTTAFTIAGTIAASDVIDWWCVSS